MNRRLKRRLEPKDLESTSPLDPTNRDAHTSSIILGSVSPRGKKRAMRRLKLCTPRSDIKTPIRLDKVNVKMSGRPSYFKEKVEKFMTNDENSVIVPDF